MFQKNFEKRLFFPRCSSEDVECSFDFLAGTFLMEVTKMIQKIVFNNYFRSPFPLVHVKRSFENSGENVQLKVENSSLIFPKG